MSCYLNDVFVVTTLLGVLAIQDVIAINCPEDFQWEWQGKCFLISTEFLNFDMARPKCIARGGILFEPCNDQNNGVLVDQVENKFGENVEVNFWIGITDKENNGQ
jgi:hypothetical protein